MMCPEDINGCDQLSPNFIFTSFIFGSRQDIKYLLASSFSSQLETRKTKFDVLAPKEVGGNFKGTIISHNKFPQTGLLKSTQ